MELVRMSDLYAVRHAIVRGRVRSLSLAQINAIIEEATLRTFVSPEARAMIEEALRDGTYRQAEGSHLTLH
jgi:aminoglycoside phosphotransferase family enzyme